VSFSILGLLAASVAMLIASNRRARRLARQQMDFVAGVSHELRTPLAVIETAAYNLDKGIIRTEQQTRAYGAMIRKESTRLRRMVEQMLEYAGVQAGRVDYVLTLSDVNNILNEALASSQR
jgi:signal transduction histidine kinase